MPINDFISADIPTASKCNLDCVYCYIPKNKLLAKIHDKWKEVYKDGSGFEIISEKFEKNNFKGISLWGAEPSLGYEDLGKLEEFLDYNPHLVEFSTSTNFTNFKSVKHLLKRLDKHFRNKKINQRFSLQISIDGPEKITKINRGEQVYKIIFNNLEKLKELLKEIKWIRVHVYCKVTCIAENFKEFLAEPEIFKDYLRLIKNKNDELAKINKYHVIKLLSLPTLGLPGTYTSEDGKVYAKFLELEEEILKELKINLNSVYVGRFKQFMTQFSDGYFRSMNMSLQCSAGVAQQAIDPDGTKHGCHSTYWYNYEDYEKEVFNLEDWSEGRRIMGVDKNTIDNHVQQVSANYRDTYNVSRLNYLLKGLAAHISHKASVGLATVYCLAKAGQISSIYKQTHWAILLASFIIFTSGCWASGSVVTGSPSCISLSIYRMLGNGAFEYVVKKVVREFLGVKNDIRFK